MLFSWHVIRERECVLMLSFCISHHILYVLICYCTVVLCCIICNMLSYVYVCKFFLGV